MFYIRADGNEKIGMGHIMRCLSIAHALKEQGEEVVFLIADDGPVKVLEEHHMTYHILFTYYDEMDVELPQLVMQLSTGGKSKILVDSYYITKFYVENLRLVATVILMDDMKTDIYPCDALVNYNIYGKTLGYEESYPRDTRLLLGCEYMPLREEFVKCILTENKTIRKQEASSKGGKNILLTTGGGDSCHMALGFVEKLMQNQQSHELPSDAEDNRKIPFNKCEVDVTFHIVCGPFCPDTEALKAYKNTSVVVNREEAKNANSKMTFQIHENVTNMSDLMSQCDFAISAAGSTLYELCAMGVPTVGFYFAENQRRNMEAFAAMTPIMNAGNYAQNPESVLDFIWKEIQLFIEEPELAEKISIAMRTIVDGKGARRLAKALLEL